MLQSHKQFKAIRQHSRAPLSSDHEHTIQSIYAKVEGRLGV